VGVDVDQMTGEGDLAYPPGGSWGGNPPPGWLASGFPWSSTTSYCPSTDPPSKAGRQAIP
jgi:hypothetical protein